MISEQKKYEMIGKYGCYLMCLFYIASHETSRIRLNLIDLYDFSLSRDWIDEECTVLNPVAILKHFTCKSFTVKKSDKPDDKAKYTIARYYNKNTGHSHFVIVVDGRVTYDSLGWSNTVKDGVIESYRLFYEGGDYE